MNSNQLKCLLCDGKTLSVVHSLTAEEILSLWASNGIRFTSSAVGPLVARQVVHLYNCDSCGFQFFDPALAGNSDFYEQLYASAVGYYAPNRDENERNARYALRHGFKTMLDVGCGNGFALDCAKRCGLETYGIELSKTASEETAARGHTVFPMLLQDMDSKWEGRFDVISMNQLLEHVPDPVDLVRQSVRFLSPRGVIAIAVPGRFGILRFTPWLEADWPPHHVSKWRHADFSTLASRIGLKVIRSGGDRLLGSALESILLGHLSRCRVLGKEYKGLAPWAIRTLSFIYRKSGSKYLFHSQGHSIFCYLAR